MRTVTKIACRIIGTAGMGVALYDASRVAGQFARNKAEQQQAQYLENIYYNSRTIDDVSYSSNGIRSKSFDLLTKNPLPSIWGKFKGGVNGVLYSLGNNVIGVGLAALALTSKGVLAKIGALGVGLGFCYKIAREGLGLGKQHPMD